MQLLPQDHSSEFSSKKLATIRTLGSPLGKQRTLPGIKLQ